jgi:hypothetical protein
MKARMLTILCVAVLARASMAQNVSIEVHTEKY